MSWTPPNGHISQSGIPVRQPTFWEKRQNKFKQERDKVLLTFDLEKIKRFYKKYRDLLIFPYLPPDDIIYRDSMEDILLMGKATKRQKKRAKAWLDEYRRVKE